MKNPPFTSGDLGEFILKELGRRGITLEKGRDLSELLASWRTRTTPDIPERPSSLVLSVRGCTFDDVARLSFALFSQSRNNSPHVLFTTHNSTGTTVLVDPLRKETDQEFGFHIPGGSGHFSRTQAGIVVFFHLRKTASFVVAEREKELEIVFTEHKTV